MRFGGFLLRRSGSWPTWLAFRSTVTAAAAIAAGWVVKATALPALTREVGEGGVASTPLPEWVLALGDWLPLVGVPGLVLGLAAIRLRRFRPPLAVLATIASVGAIVAIVGTLIGLMLPFYQQVPRVVGAMWL